MTDQIIDAHIHFDMYKATEQEIILKELHEQNVESLISVSNHLASSKNNLQISLKDNRIKPCFGYHPEQELPTEEELSKLLNFIEENQEYMVAIGEVGLPYYLRQENKNLKSERYIELLEIFISTAAKYNKPIVLHAVYEDVPIALQLLEKYSIQKAHFHWFKGDIKAMEQMAENGYFISFTPDIIYEDEIRSIALKYPIKQIMVETDGPWPFEGSFKNELTQPQMIHKSIKELAKLKQFEIEDVVHVLYENTKSFYCLS